VASGRREVLWQRKVRIWRLRWCISTLYIQGGHLYLHGGHVYVQGAYLYAHGVNLNTQGVHLHVQERRGRSVENVFCKSLGRTNVRRKRALWFWKTERTGADMTGCPRNEFIRPAVGQAGTSAPQCPCLFWKNLTIFACARAQTPYQRRFHYARRLVAWSSRRNQPHAAEHTNLPGFTIAAHTGRRTYGNRDFGRRCSL